MQDELTKAAQRLRIELRPLRGLWPGVSADLARMGFRSLADLKGRDADHLAQGYRDLANHPDDPVLVAVFRTMIRFAETGVATPWWRVLRAEIQADVTTSGSFA